MREHVGVALARGGWRPVGGEHESISSERLYGTVDVIRRLRDVEGGMGQQLSCESSIQRDCLPRSAMAQHRIEDGQQLAHACGERHLLRLTCPAQAFIK